MACRKGSREKALVWTARRRLVSNHRSSSLERYTTRQRYASECWPSGKRCAHPIARRSSGNSSSNLTPACRKTSNTCTMADDDIDIYGDDFEYDTGAIGTTEDVSINTQFASFLTLGRC